MLKRFWVMLNSRFKRSRVFKMLLIAVGMALAHEFAAGAQESQGDGQSHPDPELVALQLQNAVLQERIKLATGRRELEELNNPDPFAKEVQVLRERIKSLSEASNLQPTGFPRTPANEYEKGTDPKNETYIESVRLAYKSLAGITPDIAKELDCKGKDVVLYGPSQSEALLDYRAFREQLDLLGARLKAVLNIPLPAAPDQSSQPPGGAGGTASLAIPVFQSVLDLVALIQRPRQPITGGTPLDEGAVISSIASAAAANGCRVFWPDQYAPNPFNSRSRLMASLQSVAELNDNAGIPDKPAG